MRTFYISRNNGVIAVITAKDAKLYGALKDAGKDPFKEGISVFTFCDPDRYAKDTKDSLVFTGDYLLFSRLRERTSAVPRSFHENKANVSGWDGFVPFSNQEQSMYPDGHWLKYVTKTYDFLEKFGFIN